MVKVFVSYSRKDHRWVKRLKETLKPKGIILLSDMHFQPGENLKQGLERLLDLSEAVILLVSPDYFASRLVEEELPLILERAANGAIRLLPLVLSPTFIKSSDLKNYIFVNSEPLNTASVHQQQEIIFKLSQAIDQSVTDKALEHSKEIKPTQDKYSAALSAAITNIGGNTIGVNILGDNNIFFEAEERLTQENDKKS